MNSNEAIMLLQRAADRADAMLEMAQLTVTDARAIAKLLKEQEPVEPVPDEDGLHDRCGACGRLLHESILSRDNFCRNCGKRVKWDD